MAETREKNIYQNTFDRPLNRCIFGRRSEAGISQRAGDIKCEQKDASGKNKVVGVISSIRIYALFGFHLFLGEVMQTISNPFQLVHNISDNLLFLFAARQIYGNYKIVVHKF